MSLKQHFELLASYNQWMNSKVYEAAGQVSAADLAKDRGAFFGSIIATLNHIVVGDTIWLKRFAEHPSWRASLQEITALPTPTRMDQMLFSDFGDLHKHRVWLDEKIINWTNEIYNDDLDRLLNYGNSKGVSATRRYSYFLLHFYNHQTHHRGQVSTLLSQVGVDIGVTDLLAIIPEESRA